MKLKVSIFTSCLQTLCYDLLAEKDLEISSMKYKNDLRSSEEELPAWQPNIQTCKTQKI